MGIKNSSSGTYGKKGDDSGNKSAHQSGGRPAAHFQLDSSKFVVDVTSFISLSAKGSVTIDSQNTMGITAKSVMAVSSENMMSIDGKNMLTVGGSAGTIIVNSKGLMMIGSETSIFVNATDNISHTSKVIKSSGSDMATYGGGSAAVVTADDIKLNG